MEDEVRNTEALSLEVSPVHLLPLGFCISWVVALSIFIENLK